MRFPRVGIFEIVQCQSVPGPQHQGPEVSVRIVCQSLSAKRSVRARLRNAWYPSDGRSCHRRMRRCFRPGSSGRFSVSVLVGENDSGQGRRTGLEGRMEWHESTGNRPYGSVGRGPRAAALYGNVRSGLGAYGPSILSRRERSPRLSAGLTTDRIPGFHHTNHHISKKRR